METTEQRCARYPHLAAGYAAMSPVAWVSLPFTIEGRSVGGLSLGFETVFALTDDDKAFLLAFGRQCGLALERARLYDAERSARRAAEAAELRLAFLAEASSALGASLDYQRSLRDIVQLVASRLGEWCWIDLRESDAGPQRIIEAKASAVSLGNQGRTDLELGQRVFHGKFGYGTITAIEGNKLEIDFEKAGQKRVLDSFVSADS